MFLKEFTAGPRRNALGPMGAFVTDRNVKDYLTGTQRNICQQQLVALFASTVLETILS